MFQWFHDWRLDRQVSAAVRRGYARYPDARERDQRQAEILALIEIAARVKLKFLKRHGISPRYGDRQEIIGSEMLFRITDWRDRKDGSGGPIADIVEREQERCHDTP